MFFQIVAVLVMAAFYVIYFGKVLAGRKKGIQVNQMAKEQKSGSYRVEVILKIATYGIVPVELFCILTNRSMLSVWARIVGGIIGVLGVIVFGVSVWTMRDSWRAGIAENDRTEMITEGIYQISRNPAFLGFDLVYAGVLILFFHPLHALFAGFAMVMLHLQILQEEKYLPTVFGMEYEEYKGRVCRYLGHH